MPGWKLDQSWVHSVNVNVVNFFNLGIWSEVLVLINQRLTATAIRTSIRASINNGSSMLDQSGDYKLVGATGVYTDRVELSLTTSGNTNYSSVVWFPCWKSGLVKPVIIKGGPESNAEFIINNANPLNMLAIYNDSGNNFTGGAIHVLGKP